MLFLRSGLEESVGGEQEYPSAYAERSGKCGESHRGEKGIHGRQEKLQKVAPRAIAVKTAENP